MNLSIAYKKICFGEVKAPDPALLSDIGLSSLQYHFPITTEHGHLLSLEACEILVNACPIFLWKGKTIAPHRTYYLCANKLVNDYEIQVGVLPNKTSRDDVIMFARQVELLSVINGAIKSPIPLVYSATRKYSISNLIPLFTEPQRTIRKQLKAAERTLQDHKNDLK